MPNTQSRFFNPFRLSAYLLILYCLGHTAGALLSSPRFGAESDTVLAAMRAVHFDVQGFSGRSWYGFYYGFGMIDSVFFLFSAALCWFMGGLPLAERRRLKVITWGLFISYAFSLIIIWQDFFMVPLVLTVLLVALLGYEAWRSRTPIENS